MSQRTQVMPLEPFDASGYRVGIVVARFHADLTGQLLDATLAEAEKYKLFSEQVSVHHVAGSIEIPAMLQAVARTKRYDALVALGVIIRGETDHYAYVAKMVSEGVLRVSLDHQVPIGFGVLTCENEAQAIARTKSGADAFVAALMSAKTIRLLSSSTI